MIAFRERIHLAEQRLLEAIRQHEMSVEVLLPRNDLRERHPYLKRDARFLWQDAERTARVELPHQLVEEPAHDGVLPVEVMFERVQAGAGVRLVAIRELALALRTAPQCRLHRYAALFFSVADHTLPETAS